MGHHGAHEFKYEKVKEQEYKSKNKYEPDHKPKEADARTARERVQDWVDFSMNPQPYELIKERALKDAFAALSTDEKTGIVSRLTNLNPSMCYTYVCEHSTLTEEQIEELSAISSPLFLYCRNGITKNDIFCITAVIAAGKVPEQMRVMKYLVGHLLVSNVELLEYFRGFMNSDTNKATPIRDMLDWWAIGKYQKLSKEFKAKYSNIIPKYSGMELSFPELETSGKKPGMAKYDRLHIKKNNSRNSTRRKA